MQASYSPPLPGFSATGLLLQDVLAWHPPPHMLFLMQSNSSSSYDPMTLLLSHVADLLPMALDTFRLTALFGE